MSLSTLFFSNFGIFPQSCFVELYNIGDGNFGTPKYNYTNNVTLHIIIQMHLKEDFSLSRRKYIVLPFGIW